MNRLFCATLPGWFSVRPAGVPVGGEAWHIYDSSDWSPADLPHQARQVHRADLLWCAGKAQFHDVEADILLSRGELIGVRTADCLPILLADVGAGLYAAVHAGWRGTVAQAASRAVAELLAAGASSARLRAALGPCIGPCCFAIGADTAAELAGCVAGGESHIAQRDGRLFADLAAINRLQLLSVGLAGWQVEHRAACTCCDSEKFWSYRRDGAKSGRHLAVVGHHAAELVQ